MTRKVPVAAAAAVVLLLGFGAGCSSNANAQLTDPQRLSVQAFDNSCVVSAGEAPAGKVTFTITNRGTQVTQFVVLGAHGIRVAGAAEDIAPGITRELTLTAQPGRYFTVCRPGMVGDGIRHEFVVTGEQADSAASADDDRALIEEATRAYEAYVRHQAQELCTMTDKFVAHYKAGEDDRARALYPEARTHWERIETVTHSFRDLDPRLDARAADLAEGERWTGWHLIEKDLWPERDPAYVPFTPDERAEVADELMAATLELHTRARATSFTAHEIGHGAKALLDDVARHKVTGEEEYWSRTDLWDFQGNIDGARVAWQGLRPLLQRRDPALDRTLESGFDHVQSLLNGHRVGGGFQRYDELTPAEIRELADAVDLLSEPLSKLAAAVA